MYEDLLTKIRLKEFELVAILQSCDECFLPTDQIWLFGSRANMQQRGGDIDLYIETSLAPDQVYSKKNAFIDALYYKIGEQKIDVVVHIMQDSLELPIYSEARSTGVKLK